MRSLVTRSMKAVTWLSGSAPRKPSTGWPLTKANTAGIDWMPSCPGIEGCLSISILTSLTLPLAARTTFSKTGPSCLHGPHHSAQKSTSTGWRLDSSITSLTKVWVVVSLIRPSAGAASPVCSIVILSVLRHTVSAGPVGSPVPSSRCHQPFGLRSRVDPSPPAGKLNLAIKWCQRGRLQSGNLAVRPRYAGAGAGLLRRRVLRRTDCAAIGNRHRDDPGRVPSRLQEAHEIAARDRGGHGVDQRVIVERLVPHHGGIEHYAHAPLGVIHCRKRGDRAGLDAQRRAHELGRAEREAAGGLQQPMQRFELDHRVLERGDEVERALLVPEEQILGMAAGNSAAQRLRLLDSEQRRMRHRAVRDLQAVEEGEEIGGRGGHGMKGQFLRGSWVPDLRSRLCARSSGTRELRVPGEWSEAERDPGPSAKRAKHHTWQRF